MKKYIRNINVIFVIIIPYVMKRLTTLFTLITMSVIMNAQTRGDFFAFVDSFNWKLSKEQFEEKYASRIASKSFDSETSSYVYVLDDLSIGEYDCTTVVSIDDDLSSTTITAVIPESITKQHVQSVLSYKLDNIANEKMGMPDFSMDDVDYSQLGLDFGWPAGTTGDVKVWKKDKFNMLSFKAYTESGLQYSLYSFVPENVQIQDTFFGLKMTDRITSAQIKSAIGERGVFIKETWESKSINYLFKDVYFAGRKWDFANIVCTNSGKFYWFRVYNIYDGYSSNQKKDAKNLYDNLKNKLDDKYGDGKEQKNEDESIYTTYFGSNDMAIIISYERTKSVDGSYRRYLKIEYTNLTLYNNQIEKDIDEL